MLLGGEKWYHEVTVTDLFLCCTHWGRGEGWNKMFYCSSEFVPGRKKILSQDTRIEQILNFHKID
jgi:hypothetical protein